MKTAFFLLLSSLVLSACSTMQERNIVQTGENSYGIKKNNSSYSGPEVLQREITREARKFCRSLDKKMHIIAVHETRPPFTGSKTPNAEIKFECVSKTHL